MLVRVRLELRDPTLQISNSCRYTQRPTLSAQAAKNRIPSKTFTLGGESYTTREIWRCSLVEAWLESCELTKMNLAELDE